MKNIINTSGYFSPVLRLEEGSRRPLALLHAALTNTPAINGLRPLVAKSSSQQSAVSSQWGEAGFGAGRQIPPNPPLVKGGTDGEGEDSSQQSATSSSQQLAVSS